MALEIPSNNNYNYFTTLGITMSSGSIYSLLNLSKLVSEAPVGTGPIVERTATILVQALMLVKPTMTHLHMQCFCFYIV